MLKIRMKFFKTAKALHEILPRLPKITNQIAITSMGDESVNVRRYQRKGPILVIDVHMVVSIAWLPPLLDPIVRNPKTITQSGVEILKPDKL